MPAPIPDLSRDQTCHHYQAPTGQRCGAPALKGEYYCYHHHIKHARRSRVLIDPELTRMELPPIEDRAGIFVALVAIVHRLAENTIDTRRSGHMIYALQNALLTLPPAGQTAPTPTPAPDPQPAAAAAAPAAPAPAAAPAAESAAAPAPEPAAESESATAPAPEPAAESESESAAAPEAASTAKPLQTLAASSLEPSRTPTAHSSHRTTQPAPTQISMSKDSLLYFLRSRHCAHCNAELFPAHELTLRSHPGAWPNVIEESRFAGLPSLHAVAERHLPQPGHRAARSSRRRRGS